MKYILQTMTENGKEVFINLFGGYSAQLRTFCTIVGVLGSTIANFFGGWDMALQTLVLFMSIDFIMGLTVAGVFKASKKTKSGKLESGKSFIGLCRKGAMLFVVLIAFNLDKMTGSNFIRSAVVIGYTVNELISITENLGLMGVGIPPVILNAIEVLKKKADGKNE